jgi:hypothetical protein
MVGLRGPSCCPIRSVIPLNNHLGCAVLLSYVWTALFRHVDNIMTTNNHAFPLTAIDREILAMKDEDFALVTWEELKEIIGNSPLS